jgi:tripartite-type tricarboxylate transporter receptor subunit TctC
MEQKRIAILGATGSIGTRNALEARPDGYTWASGSSVSLGLYPVLDMLDTSLDDWHIFLTVANVPVISVNPDTPYEDFGDLLQALEQQPGEIRVATAGVASTGHKVMELICQQTGLEYRHARYDGGNPAVIATVGGETQVTPQLASEQAPMIRAGRLRPLAAFSTEPLELEGYGTIPPITNWLEDVDIPTDYFGIWVRKGVAPEVVETMEQVWRERVQNSESLQEYARREGALFTPYYGDEARERTWETVVSDAWTLYDIGQAAMQHLCQLLRVAALGTEQNSDGSGRFRAGDHLCGWLSYTGRVLSGRIESGQITADPGELFRRKLRCQPI